MSRELNTLLDEKLNKVFENLSTLTNKEAYEALSTIDPEGWYVYYASKEILKVNVYEKFTTEDSLGWLEEFNGHDLKRLAEISVFGNKSYKEIADGTEVLDKYTIDYTSKEFKDYLDKLYPLAVTNLKDRALDLMPLEKKNLIYSQDKDLEKDTCFKNQVDRLIDKRYCLNIEI